MQRNDKSPLEAPVPGADCPNLSCSTLVLGRWCITAGLVSSIRAQLHELPQSVTYVIEPLVKLALQAGLFVFDACDLLLK